MAGALAALLALAGCTRREAAPVEQVLRVAQRNEPATLDPQLASLPDEFFVIRALGEGLVLPNPAGGRPLPAAAARWESSPDARTWTFHLSPDALWSNGEPVKASDFAYMIRRAQAPATASPKASLFANVAAAATPDDRTLVLTLHRPDRDLPALAASGPWIPVHPATVEQYGRGWTQPAHFVGNGPFLLEEWRPNQRIVVRRNPRARNAGEIRLERIEFVAFDSGDTEERAFRRGQIDVTMAVPAGKLDAYRDREPAVLQTAPLHETRLLSLNTTRAPLTDSRVRRALSLALDRATLTGKVLKGGQQPALSYVPPGLGGYRPGLLLREDAAEARRLLATAGYPGGRGFPKLELGTWGAGTAVLEAVQQRWREVLGIEITLVQREARSHLAALFAGDYDLAFVPAIPDYDSPRDLLDRLVTGRPENYPHWQNADYDGLVAAGDWQAAEKLLLEELPLIPLYFNSRNYLRRPGVHGWTEDALWNRSYRGVSISGP